MEQFVVRTPSLSSLSLQAVAVHKLPSYTFRISSTLGDAVGQKVYGIDKTLLVPLVQPSVDIIQGQVSQLQLQLYVQSQLQSQPQSQLKYSHNYIYNYKSVDYSSYCSSMHVYHDHCCVREERLLLRSGTESCCCQAWSSTKTSTSATHTTLQGRCKPT